MNQQEWITEAFRQFVANQVFPPKLLKILSTISDEDYQVFQDIIGTGRHIDILDDNQLPLRLQKYTIQKGMDSAIVYAGCSDKIYLAFGSERKFTNQLEGER